MFCFIFAFRLIVYIFDLSKDLLTGSILKCAFAYNSIWSSWGDLAFDRRLKSSDTLTLDSFRKPWLWLNKGCRTCSSLMAVSSAGNDLDVISFPPGQSVPLWCKYMELGASSVVRVSDSWSKGPGFESWQERWKNFFLQGQLSLLTLISVSVPPLCYRSST